MLMNGLEPPGPGEDRPGEAGPQPEADGGTEITTPGCPAQPSSEHWSGPRWCWSLWHGEVGFPSIRRQPLR